MLSNEFLFEIIHRFKNKSAISLATTYYLQSPYNKRSEFDYLVLTGHRYTTHWHYTMTHLFNTLTANSLVFTFSKASYAWWVYVREDFLVDNAPDAQTGIGLKFYLDK